jgi:glycine betaine catabolism B
MKAQFVTSKEVAEGMRSFYFQPEKKLSYTAGQFIELTIPHEADDRGNRRWFTASSSPTEEYIAITTRLTAEGGSSFKQALCDLKMSDPVTVSDPMGDFVLPKDPTVPITFVVGGIGITPVRSMVKWLYDIGQHRTLQLIYAASRIEDFAFRELFTTYGLPTSLILSNPSDSWEGLRGHLTAKQILKLSPDAETKLFFLSGPEPLVEKLNRDLNLAGVDKVRIVGDYFLNYTTV